MDERGWILILDVVAWIWGTIFTTAWLIVVSGSAVETHKWGGIRNLPGTRRGFWIYGILATVCWVWVVAG